MCVYVFVCAYVYLSLYTSVCIQHAHTPLFQLPSFQNLFYRIILLIVPYLKLSLTFYFPLPLTCGAHKRGVWESFNFICNFIFLYVKCPILFLCRELSFSPIPAALSYASLSMFLSSSLTLLLSIYLCIYLSIYLAVYLSNNLSLFLSLKIKQFE